MTEVAIEEKPLSEVSSFDEFKDRRRELKKASEVPTEPKEPQTEEVTRESAAESRTAETRVQEQQESPAEKSLDDQIRELRKTGKHAAANKLEREAGASDARKPLETELAKLRQELEGLRSRPSQPEAPKEIKTETAPAKQDSEPDINDQKYAGADGYTEFVSDRAVWKWRQEQQQQEAAKSQQTFNDKVKHLVEDGAAKTPDFREVVDRVKINTKVLNEGIRVVENFGEVLYALGTNPTKLAAIQALSPIDQWAEIRFLSRELSSSNTPVTPPEKLKPAVSRVSAPPRILSGNDTPEPKATSEARDFDDFKRIRQRLRKAS